jgi:hypothetical protein
MAEDDSVPEQTCKACKHWHKLPSEAQSQRGSVPTPLGRASLLESKAPPDVARGHCRRYPPTITMLPTNQGLCQAMDYPNVPSNYPACGEFIVVLGLIHAGAVMEEDG